MAEFIVSDLKITEENKKSDIAKLVETIKPLWNLEKLQIKILSGGYTNRLFRCYVDNPKDSVIIRVRHRHDNITKEKIQNPLELKIVQHLSSTGHFSKLLATFANGYCYQYIEGQPMIDHHEKTGYVNELMLRSIAEEMAFIHSIRLEGEDYNDKNAFSFHNSALDSLDSEKFLRNDINKNVILKEFNLVTDFIKKNDSDIVLCHGDSHPGNYVWNEEQEKVTFVDWEGVRIGYRLLDIAELFVNTKLLDKVYLKLKAKRIIEEGFEQRFLNYYLQEWEKLQGKNTQITEKYIVDYIKRTEIFQMVQLLIQLIFGILAPDFFEQLAGDLSPIDDAMEDYLKLKEKIFGKRHFEGVKA